MRWQSVIYSGLTNDSSPQPKTQQHPLGAHRPRFGLRRAPGIKAGSKHVHNQVPFLGGQLAGTCQAETTLY